jgi:hypothetical protein
MLICNDVRLNLAQENKEVLNMLEKSGYDLNHFGYCKVSGFIESLISHKTCEKWVFISEE